MFHIFRVVNITLQWISQTTHWPPKAIFSLSKLYNLKFLLPHTNETLNKLQCQGYLGISAAQMHLYFI